MFVKRPNSSVRRQRKVATEMEKKYGLVADARLYDMMPAYGLDNPDRAAPLDKGASNHKTFDKASNDQPGPGFSQKKEDKPTFGHKARKVACKIGRPFVWYYNWTFNDPRDVYCREHRKMQKQGWPL